MIKKIIIILTVFVIGAITVFLNFQKIKELLLPDRPKINSRSQELTKYEGVGQVTKRIDAKAFIIPKGEGRPMFITVEEKVNYSADLYDIYDIPAQDQLLYTVGNFQGWEEINGTIDKYILILNPKTDQIEKHRVAFEPSQLFSGNVTRITGATFDELKINDKLVMFPLFDPPILAKKDDERNYLTVSVVIQKE